MLSARGAQGLSIVLSEVVSDHLKTGHGAVWLLSDVQRAWKAASTVLRSQLLLGRDISIDSLACFLGDTKCVAADGPKRYFVREHRFGFGAGFARTYGFDPSLPVVHEIRGPNLRDFQKLPMEYVAAEAKLPAEFVQEVIHQVFLYVGETIFNGKLVQLDFPGVASVLVKREKAVVTFDAQFSEEVFEIDSRKWPLAVREAVSEARKQTISSSGQRSRSPRPATGSTLAGSNVEDDAVKQSRPAAHKENENVYAMIPPSPERHYPLCREEPHGVGAPQDIALPDPYESHPSDVLDAAVDHVAQENGRSGEESGDCKPPQDFIPSEPMDFGNDFGDHTCFSGPRWGWVHPVGRKHFH